MVVIPTGSVIVEKFEISQHMHPRNLFLHLMAWWFGELSLPNHVSFLLHKSSLEISIQQTPHPSQSTSAGELYIYMCMYVEPSYSISTYSL